MKFVPVAFRILRAIVKTLRLALPKLGVGWMFALLTINFNRIAIHELNIVAVAVTSMLAMHYFLSPFQVITGRIADKHPIFGLRRTPYLMFAAITSGLSFMLLPSLVHAMGTGAPLAYVGGFGFFVLFGVAIAVFGDSHHSLIAEVTEARARGGVMAVVMTFTVMSTIFAAVIMNVVMPEYSPESMQTLYNLTPWIVIGSAVLGILGMEKRLTGEELQASIERAQLVAPAGNPIAVAIKVLRENKQAFSFFIFVFLSIFAIFLQDNILEVFGAEVFGMSLEETTKFQPTWGGGVLVGMAIMGVISVSFNVSKRNIAILGAVGTSIGMMVLASAAITGTATMVKPALMGMGFFTGFFNVGALAMMMDMTVDGATGLYMGLWGMAQAFGMGAASIGSGVLHTGLIETGLLGPNGAYFFIFGLEALGMAGAAIILYSISVKRFHGIHQERLTSEDALRALEVGAVA